MPPLLLDRYLVVNATHACDLATGNMVPTDGLMEPRMVCAPPAAALAEVLDHGHDGQPRALVAHMAGESDWKAAADRVAADAVHRGYVPIAAQLYARVLPIISEQIAERTLMVIAAAHDALPARQAFVDAASRTPRPHVLLTLHAGSGQARLGIGTPPEGTVQQVREARAAYDSTRRPRPATPTPTDVLQHLQRARRADELVAAGRHAAAERLLRDVSAALGRRRAWLQAASVAMALGRLLLERGRPLDAVRAFGDATASAATAGGEDVDAEARIWLATARTDAAQLTSAESICRALLQVASLSDALRIWTTGVLVRVLLWQGRTREALALPPLGAAPEGVEPDTAAFIDAAAVRLLLVGGRLFDAGLRARQALDSGRNVTRVGRIIELTSHLRVLTATGDLTSAGATLSEIRRIARQARTPLRLLRARLIWAEGLRRAGPARSTEADREWRGLARMARVASPLLQEAIARRHVAASSAEPGTGVPGIGDHELSAATLVRIAHDEDDEAGAVTRLLEASARRLHATRIDIWSADAGPASIVQSAGTGLSSTIGGRVIDAGLQIGPGGAGAPGELGLPVRLGSRLLAAIVARWPADRVPPPDAANVLELVGAVAAPRLDTLLHRARTESEAATLIPELIGVSRAIGDVRQAVARAAAAPFGVLVEGESGVGKELIARAVHYLSPRRERRFCDVNCAALPDELLESELFGHARGAFTGAIADRAGLFEEAHGGTLFLDEVADLSPRAQAKLLRVLQQQEIRRVGEGFARPVDVRLVAAANRDMRAEAAAGRFRQDLLYRLDVIRIDVPPLRARPEDIPVLAQHFWRAAADRVGTVAALGPAVITALAAYHWPGNVRELQNVIAAVAVAAPRRGRVPADVLPAAIIGSTPLRTTRLADARQQFERRFVEVTLAQAGGNRARAARALGLSRQGLLKLIDRLRIATG